MGALLLGGGWVAPGGCVAIQSLSSAAATIRAAVHEVSQELVVSPVEHELDAFRTVRNGLDAALGK